MEYQKVLIAVDDSPLAEKVAAKGFQLVKRLAAETALVSVVDTAFLMTAGAVTPAELAVVAKSELMKTHEMLQDKVFKEYKVWSFVEEGKPYEVILKVAKEWAADLIVLGTHGRTGVSHLLMGSVTEQVLRHTTIPLLVVPSK